MHSPLESFGTVFGFCVFLPLGVPLPATYESHTFLVGSSGLLMASVCLVVFEAFGPWGLFVASGLLVPWVSFDPFVLSSLGSFALVLVG